MSQLFLACEYLSTVLWTPKYYPVVLPTPLCALQSRRFESPFVVLPSVPAAHYLDASYRQQNQSLQYSTVVQFEIIQQAQIIRQIDYFQLNLCTFVCCTVLYMYLCIAYCRC